MCYVWYVVAVLVVKVKLHLLLVSTVSTLVHSLPWSPGTHWPLPWSPALSCDQYPGYRDSYQTLGKPIIAPYTHHLDCILCI